LREERGLENRLLGIVFGPRRDEVTREWRKIHKEELIDLHSFSLLRLVHRSREDCSPLSTCERDGHL